MINLCPLVLAREEGLSVVNNTGSILIYDCSVVGEGSTVWTGFGFDCPSSGDCIILRHITKYNTTSGTCNDGAITGRGVSVDGDCFTSQLKISYTPDLKGTNVTCIYDNGSINVIIGTTPIVYIPGPEKRNVNLGNYCMQPARVLMHGWV